MDSSEITIAEPVDVGTAEQRQLIQLLNYRKTLLCFTTIDFAFCLLSLITSSNYMLAFIFIACGYLGVKNYSECLTGIYIFYNILNVFFYAILTLFILFDFENAKNLYTFRETNDINNSTNNPSNTHNSQEYISPISIIAIMFNLLIHCWITKITIRFVMILTYVKKNSLIFDRYRNENFQVVNNVNNREWNREYLW